MNEEFIKRIIALKGGVGKKWLEDLPEIIKNHEKAWEIKVFSPFQLSYNYVAPAQTSEGKHVVLKVSFPDNDQFITELEALKFYNGNGSIKILQEDRENDAILLEKAEPGLRLREIIDERKQISTASNVLKDLQKPIPADYSFRFPTIAEWAKVFERHKKTYSQGVDPVPSWMFEKAKEIFKQYLSEETEQVLLHGDLHSDNILSSARGWLSIDPKGITGEREFELGAYLRNPYYDFPKGSDYKKIEINRILQFSEELGFDKERIKNWAFSCAVISLLWFLEDEKHFKQIYVQNAELLNSIKL
jgi:streptomycin 6-kinase